MSVPWPITALPGRRPGEGQGDLINAYASKVGDVVQIRRTPGLQRALAVGASSLLPPRGMHGMPTRLIHVWDDEVHSWDGTTDTTLTGTPVATSDRFTFASNLRSDPVPDLVIVSDVAAYFVDLDAGTVAAYPDGDLGSVTSVEYFSGYFFFTRSNGQIVASDLQNTDIDPLSVATAEYAPDPLLRLKNTGSALLAFGSRSIEVWVDVGSSPFPLQRQTALDIGLLGQWAVAGGTNEWGNGVLFVASDYSVRWMDGLTPKVVSNDDVAHDIFLQRANVDGIVAQVYEFEGQAVFSITTDDWTWEYNLITGAWHRRDSYGQANWRATSAAAFNYRWYVQDTLNAYLFEILPEHYWEDTERMRFRCESGPLKGFPASVRIPSIDIDCSVALGLTGVPSPFETDPAIMISWSHDGGANWSRPVARSLGQIGRYGAKVTVNGLGRSTHHGTRIRADVTDPVPVTITGGVATRASASRARQVET